MSPETAFVPPAAVPPVIEEDQKFLAQVAEDAARAGAATPPPFKVYNRTRAQKLAKRLFGLNARVWIKRPIEFVENAPPMTPKPGAQLGVWVGLETGSTKEVLTIGKDFSAALRNNVEIFVKGAGTYDGTKERLREMSAFADVTEFVIPALKQFPQYEAEVQKSVEKFKKLLAKGKELSEKTK